MFIRLHVHVLDVLHGVNMAIKMKMISNKKINELLQLIKQAKIRTDDFPWKWEDMEFILEDDGTYITVSETSYLGDTGICLGTDSYDDHGIDCYIVQEAIEWLEPLLKEVKKSRQHLAKF